MTVSTQLYGKREKPPGRGFLNLLILSDAWTNVVELWFPRVVLMFRVSNYGGETITEVYEEEGMMYDE
jgi:hypothetical protein